MILNLAVGGHSGGSSLCVNLSQEFIKFIPGRQEMLP